MDGKNTAHKGLDNHRAGYPQAPTAIIGVVREEENSQAKTPAGHRARLQPTPAHRSPSPVPLDHFAPITGGQSVAGYFERASKAARISGVVVAFEKLARTAPCVVPRLRTMLAEL